MRSESVTATAAEGRGMGCRRAMCQNLLALGPVMTPN